MAGDPELEARVRTAADLVTPMAIRVAATLKVADHIAAGIGTVPGLAQTTGSDSDALRRLLNHLVTAGFVTQDPDGGVFGLTELGEQLCGDGPDRVRAWLTLDGATGHAELSMVELLHTVRTGQPAFVHRYGRTFWEQLSDDSALSASFDALMGAQEISHPMVAQAYDWGQLGHVVDVGGGNASLLIALLTAHPGLRGTLVDLPGPAAAARSAVKTASLDHCIDVISGSFFDPLPAGAGGYVLSSIIHDWDDTHAHRILRRCAQAAGRHGRVLMIEQTQTQGGKAQRSAMDLRMLAYFRGQERTLDQLGELAGAAGLAVTAVHPVGFRSIVEMITVATQSGPEDQPM